MAEGRREDKPPDMGDLLEYFESRSQVLDAEGQPVLDMSTLQFMSLIKFNGAPILPPVLSAGRREEMMSYKQEAMRRQSKSKLKKREELHAKVHSIVTDVDERRAAKQSSKSAVTSRSTAKSPSPGSRRNTEKRQESPKVVTKVVSRSGAATPSEILISVSNSQNDVESTHKSAKSTSASASRSATSSKGTAKTTTSPARSASDVKKKEPTNYKSLGKIGSLSKQKSLSSQHLDRPASALGRCESESITRSKKTGSLSPKPSGSGISPHPPEGRPPSRGAAMRQSSSTPDLRFIGASTPTEELLRKAFPSNKSLSPKGGRPQTPDLSRDRESKRTDRNNDASVKAKDSSKTSESKDTKTRRDASSKSGSKDSSTNKPKRMLPEHKKASETKAVENVPKKTTDIVVDKSVVKSKAAANSVLHNPLEVLEQELSLEEESERSSSIDVRPELDPVQTATAELFPFPISEEQALATLDSLQPDFASLEQMESLPKDYNGIPLTSLKQQQIIHMLTKLSQALNMEDTLTSTTGSNPMADIVRDVRGQTSKSENYTSSVRNIPNGASGSYHAANQHSDVDHEVSSVTQESINSSAHSRARMSPTGSIMSAASSVSASRSRMSPKSLKNTVHFSTLVTEISTSASQSVEDKISYRKLDITPKSSENFEDADAGDMNQVTRGVAIPGSGDGPTGAMSGLNLLGKVALSPSIDTSSGSPGEFPNRHPLEEGNPDGELNTSDKENEFIPPPQDDSSDDNYNSAPGRAMRPSSRNQQHVWNVYMANMPAGPVGENHPALEKASSVRSDISDTGLLKDNPDKMVLQENWARTNVGMDTQYYYGTASTDLERYMQGKITPDGSISSLQEEITRSYLYSQQNLDKGLIELPDGQFVLQKPTLSVNIPDSQIDSQKSGLGNVNIAEFDEDMDQSAIHLQPIVLTGNSLQESKSMLNAEEQIRSNLQRVLFEDDSDDDDSVEDVEQDVVADQGIDQAIGDYRPELTMNFIIDQAADEVNNRDVNQVDNVSNDDNGEEETEGVDDHSGEESESEVHTDSESDEFESEAEDHTETDDDVHVAIETIEQIHNDAHEDIEGDIKQDMLVNDEIVESDTEIVKSKNTEPSNTCAKSNITLIETEEAVDSEIETNAEMEIKMQEVLDDEGKEHEDSDEDLEGEEGEEESAVLNIPDEDVAEAIGVVDVMAKDMEGLWVKDIEVIENDDTNDIENAAENDIHNHTIENDIKVTEDDHAIENNIKVTEDVDDRNDYDDQETQEEKAKADQIQKYLNQVHEQSMHNEEGQYDEDDELDGVGNKPRAGMDDISTLIASFTSTFKSMNHISQEELFKMQAEQFELIQQKLIEAQQSQLEELFVAQRREQMNLQQEIEMYHTKISQTQSDIDGYVGSNMPTPQTPTRDDVLTPQVPARRDILVPPQVTPRHNVLVPQASNASPQVTQAWQKPTLLPQTAMSPPFAVKPVPSSIVSYQNPNMSFNTTSSSIPSIPYPDVRPYMDPRALMEASIDPRAGVAMGFNMGMSMPMGVVPHRLPQDHGIRLPQGQGVLPQGHHTTNSLPTQDTNAGLAQDPNMSCISHSTSYSTIPHRDPGMLRGNLVLGMSNIQSQEDGLNQSTNPFIYPTSPSLYVNPKDGDNASDVSSFANVKTTAKQLVFSNQSTPVQQSRSQSRLQSHVQSHTQSHTQSNKSFKPIQHSPQKQVRHQSQHGGRYIIPDEVFSDEMQPKFARVTAVVRGYLTRRLLKSHKVQDIIKTINDTRNVAFSFQAETPIKKGTFTREDRTFLAGIINQLQSALLDIHEIFFLLPVPERMAIIALSRQLNEEEMMRKSSQRLSKDSVSRSQPKLSKATLKAMERKKKAQLAEEAVFGSVEFRPKSAPPATSSPATDISGPLQRHYHSLFVRALRPLQGQMSPIHADNQITVREMKERPRTAPDKKRSLDANTKHKKTSGSKSNRHSTGTTTGKHKNTNNNATSINKTTSNNATNQGKATSNAASSKGPTIATGYSKPSKKSEKAWR